MGVTVIRRYKHVASLYTDYNSYGASFVHHGGFRVVAPTGRVKLNTPPSDVRGYETWCGYLVERVRIWIRDEEPLTLVERALLVLFVVSVISLICLQHKALESLVMIGSCPFVLTHA